MNFAGIEQRIIHSASNRRPDVSCRLPTAVCRVVHQGYAVTTTEDKGVVGFNAITLGASFQCGR